MKTKEEVTVLHINQRKKSEKMNQFHLPIPKLLVY